MLDVTAAVLAAPPPPCVSHPPPASPGPAPLAQALLDVYTIQREIGRLDNFRIGLIGDLANGRTVRSLAYVLSMYPGVKMYFVAPDVVGAARECNLAAQGCGHSGPRGRGHRRAGAAAPGGGVCRRLLQPLLLHTAALVAAYTHTRQAGSGASGNPPGGGGPLLAASPPAPPLGLADRSVWLPGPPCGPQCRMKDDIKTYLSGVGVDWEEVDDLAQARRKGGGQA